MAVTLTTVARRGNKLITDVEATADTEDIEKFVPESLLFCSFALDARPIL